MVRGERDHFGVFVNLTDDIKGADAAVFTDVEQPHFNAAIGKSHPRVNVRRIIVEVDDNIGALAPVEAAGDVAQGEGGRADERDFFGFCAEHLRGEGARFLDEALRHDCFLIGEGAVESVIAHSFGDASRQWADAGVAQKYFVARDGEFVVAQFFVTEDFLESHFSRSADFQTYCIADFQIGRC